MPGNTALLKKILQWWQAVGNTVFDLTAPRFEPQTSSSRDEHTTGRPINQLAKQQCICIWSGRSEVKIWTGQLNTVLPTAHHHRDSSSKGAVLPWQNDAEMGPANSLHALVQYRKYNKRFDLKKNLCLMQQCSSCLGPSPENYIDTNAK